MRDVKEINNELENLKKELAENKGTVTEVYTRIVGYYRSVRNWNKGKREEYDFRTPYLQPQFSETGTAALQEAVEQAEETTAQIDSQKELFGRSEGYLYFCRQTCPNCPPVKDFLNNLEMNGTTIDVDTAEGLEAAGRWGVYAAPTAIFLSEDGEEIFRSSKADEMAARLEQADKKVLQEA